MILYDTQERQMSVVREEFWHNLVPKSTSVLCRERKGTEQILSKLRGACSDREKLCREIWKYVSQQIEEKERHRVEKVCGEQQCYGGKCGRGSCV